MDNQKFYMKLRELVYRGSVTWRVKGKNCRIKTPSCPALRKINQVESEFWFDQYPNFYHKFCGILFEIQIEN